MSTALIIVCIVLCIAIVLVILTQLGSGIQLDKIWRNRMHRDQAGGRERQHFNG